MVLAAFDVRIALGRVHLSVMSAMARGRKNALGAMAQEEVGTVCNVRVPDMMKEDFLVFFVMVRERMSVSHAVAKDIRIALNATVTGIFIAKHVTEKAK